MIAGSGDEAAAEPEAGAEDRGVRVETTNCMLLLVVVVVVVG